MRQRYCRYMNDIRPSDALMSRIETQMCRELRQKRRRNPVPTRLTAVAAAAAALALAVVGLQSMRPRVDLVSPPSVSSPIATEAPAPTGEVMALSAANGTTAPLQISSTVDEAVSASIESDVLFGLKMTDETVAEIMTDVNYYYGCWSLQSWQAPLDIHSGSSADSPVIAQLVPGDVFWYADPTESWPDSQLRQIRWFDAATASMQTGWVNKPESSGETVELIELGIPGKTIADNAVMRNGASVNAPEIIALTEGQYLHLSHQVGNWIFATTAPFDQTGENPPLPTAGWVYVQDVVGLRYADDDVEPTAAPTVNPDLTYPPDDVRLELEMSSEAIFASSDVINSWDNILGFNDNLVGTHSSSIVEIHQSSELNSVVDEPLRPGTAYWPHKDASAGDIVDLTDEKGKKVGHAERVTYLNPETNTLKEGWKHTVYSAKPLPEVPDNPVETINKPGKVLLNDTPLRYGTSADAPVITILEEGRMLRLGYRVGNWIYASTDSFCQDGETAYTGWIHITEVAGVTWRTTINHVELTADEVNLRDKPDGNILAVLDKNTQISYGGATVPGKEGSWHFVTVGQLKGNVTGYISADYSKLHTFRLESELNLDGVISATLSYSDTAPFGAAEQTVTGEKLSILLERLKNACSESVYTEVCGEGTAQITLNYQDGHTVSLPLSGDSCTQVRHGDVTYDLKTDAERTERFLNDGGVGLSDILSPIFDQIKFS